MTGLPLSQSSNDDLRDAEAKLRAIKDGKRQRDAHLQLNECPACGAYRLDGKPPLIHAEDCPYKDDTPLMYLPSDHES
jgi:hypothetical protein